MVSTSVLSTGRLGEQVGVDVADGKKVSSGETVRFYSESGDSFSVSWYRKQPTSLVRKMGCSVVLVQLLIRSLPPTPFDISRVVPGTFAATHPLRLYSAHRSQHSRTH